MVKKITGVLVTIKKTFTKKKKRTILKTALEKLLKKSPG